MNDAVKPAVSDEACPDLETALDAFWNVAYQQGQEQRGHDDQEGTAQKAETDLRRAIAALAAQGQEPAAVKALEWSKISKPNESCGYDHTRAASVIGEYSIEWKSWKDHDDFTVFLHGAVTEHIGNGGWGKGALDAAKAIAQADYETRIRSALTAPAQPVGVPGGSREKQIVAMADVLASCRWFKPTETGMEVKCSVWATRLWEAANALAAAPQPPAEDGWRPGDNVICSSDIGDYRAIVKAFVEGWWELNFPDGSTAVVRPSRLKPAPANGGDHG